LKTLTKTFGLWNGLPNLLAHRRIEVPPVVLFTVRV
jgi:hypothetical protein